MNKFNILSAFCFGFLGMITSYGQTFNITANGQTGSQTFTSNGTVVVSSGITATVRVQLWGGGGGGGNTGTNGTNGGGGGGYTNVATVTLNAGSYPVVVGTGGGPGLNGNPSTFFGSNAGGGLTNGTGGTGTTNNGGDGGAAATNAGGGGGEGACTTGAGTDGAGGSGNTGGAGGGTCDGGNGGAGGNRGANGVNGAAPGGGGGGKGRNNPSATTAGSGAGGQVIVTIITALPVELTHFSVESNNLANVILWQTASELNNEKFEVLRKEASEEYFTEIAEVAGNGTSHTLNDYTYLDYTATASGDYCYRLKQIDFDGAYEHSDIVCNDKTDLIQQLSVYPNPFSNHITIVIPHNNIAEELYLLSAQGEKLFAIPTLDSPTATINTEHLTPGVYYVKVGALVERVIKQ